MTRPFVMFRVKQLTMLFKHNRDMTVKRAAILLDLDPSTIYKLIQRNCDRRMIKRSTEDRRKNGTVFPNIPINI